MRLPALLALTTALVWTTSSLWTMSSGQMLLNQAGSAGGAVTAPSGSCSASTAFFLRAGSIDTIHHNAYDALICGGVTDGWWAKMDAFYVHTTQTVAQAVLNLVSSSYTLTSTSPPTFVADAGVNWDGATTFYDTNFVPSTAGGHYQQNSASFGVCKKPTMTTNNAEGQYDGVNATHLFFAFNVAGTVNILMNTLSGGADVPIPTAVHLWTMTRTASNLTTLYQDGTALTPTDTSTSSANMIISFYLGARHQPAGAFWFDGDTSYVSFIGGGLTATDAGNIHTRVNTYMGAVGTARC